jgi:hypothetical protein
MKNLTVNPKGCDVVRSAEKGAFFVYGETVNAMESIDWRRSVHSFTALAEILSSTWSQRQR